MKLFAFRRNNIHNYDLKTEGSVAQKALVVNGIHLRWLRPEH